MRSVFANIADSGIRGIGKTNEVFVQIPNDSYPDLYTEPEIKADIMRGELSSYPERIIRLSIWVIA